MLLKNLYNLFAEHPEGRWIVQPENARLLFQFVKEHPIKRVLDLGTGIGASSSIIALALKEKGEDFYIDSLEQFDKCIKIANNLIPSELKEHITIHKSEVKIWQTDKIPYQYFSVFEPEGDYDLILNDAPAPFMEGEHYIDLPNGTITKMLIEDKLKAGTLIAWDGRLHMLKILERYYGDNFFLVRPSQRDDFNVLERKDNPVIFRDEKLEMMKVQHYFETAINPNNSQTPQSPNATADSRTAKAL